MPDTHKCFAKNCRKRISTAYLMCPPHWSRLPFSLQQEVLKSHRSGNAKAYNDAIKAAREHLEGAK